MISPKKNIINLHREKDYGTDRSPYIRFDKNERTISFPDDVFKGMMSKISNEAITMYPDQSLLYKKIAEFLSIDEDHILLTAGSDAAIKSIYETYIETGSKVVYLWPTYAMIDVYAKMFEANIAKIEYSSTLEIKFEKLLKEIDKTTKAVFIANPNQPTGTILTDKQISQLIIKTKETDTLLIFDEAYVQFSNQESCIKYVEEFSHIVILQTFSKAFGLASARLGYIITNPINIQWLYKVKSYSDINLYALLFGEYLVENYSVVEEYVQGVKDSKDLLEVELSVYDINVIKGNSNFVHLKFPKNTDKEFIVKKMKQKGYLIRNTGEGLPAVLEGCIRVTVGMPHQMKKFVEVLSHFIN